MDEMRRIGPTDLSILKNTPAENTATSSSWETAATNDAVCPDCGGVGFYKERVPYGHPHFGVLFPCHCKQQERELRRRAELERVSNLEPFRDKTFQDFNPDVPGVRAAYARALEYARRPQGWLVMFGPYGVGKTHLAAAIANEILGRGGNVLFAIVPDLLDHLRSTFGPSSEVEYDRRFETVRDVGVLILDDLGTENTTPWASEKLFQIINHRYNYRLPTVITSNRDPAKIDPRIYSRLADTALSGKMLMINAADYRQLTIEQRIPRYDPGAPRRRLQS
jgi:DNA replication protein DnaC